MRLLQIRARTNEDADCLVRELAVYSPRRLKRSVLFELEERSQTDLLAMLSAVETCLSANDIRSVRIELDGKKYTMAPPELSR
jgi:xanthine dehydrogenase iron-sulfur cluster and FAD-binding subunit A